MQGSYILADGNVMENVKSGVDQSTLNGQGKAFVAGPTSGSASKAARHHIRSLIDGQHHRSSRIAGRSEEANGGNGGNSGNGGDMCTQYIGRACQNNQFVNSGLFSSKDTEALDHFKGLNRDNIAAAEDTSQVKQNVLKSAGQGKI